MLAMVVCEAGGSGLSKTPSFAMIRDRLAKKIRLDHYGISQKYGSFDQYGTMMAYLILIVKQDNMGALNKTTIAECDSSK